MITINGEEWRVLLVSPFHPQLQRSDGSWTIGACDDMLKTIYLCEDLNKSLLRKVLCHELVHAFMFSYDVDLSYDEEEMVAEIMSEYGEDILEYTNTIYNGIRMK